jgi:hypothetical protein
MMTDTQKRLLQCLSVLPFLTVQQMTQLRFSAGSASYVSTLLKGLWEQGYVTRQAVPGIHRVGSVPWIYSLAAKGRSYLRHSDGISRSAPYLSHRRGITDYDDLRHDLGITDLLIAGYLFAKHHPDIVLVRMMHDRMLRATPKWPVVFDGWLEFLAHGAEQQCIALEYERSVKDAATFAEKITDILHCITPDPIIDQSLYEQRFGTTALTIAYVTSISPAYAETMRERTEQVLAHAVRRQDADVFRFRYIPVGPVDPAVYDEQSWSRPFDPQLVSLLSL